MFHISPDARAQASAVKLCDALEQLLEDRPLEQVTVSELVRCAGVGRATFYRLFDTPVDVVAYRCELILQKVLVVAASNFSPRTVTATSALLLEGWMRHPTLLTALAHAGRTDILRQSHRRHVAEVQSLFSIPGPDATYDAQLLVDIITALIPVAIDDWIRRGATETAKELSIRTRAMIRLAAI